MPGDLHHAAVLRRPDPGVQVREDGSVPFHNETPCGTEEYEHTVSHKVRTDRSIVIGFVLYVSEMSVMCSCVPALREHVVR